MLVINIENAKLITKAMERAVVRAVNKAMAKAQTAAVRHVRSIYNIKARDIKPLIGTYKANKNRARAGFFIQSRYGLKLLYFQAKDIDPRGVQFQVLKKKSRQILKHAFIAKMPSGHINVFQRTGETKIASRGRYRGKRRETLRSLYSVDPVKMFELHATEIIEQTLNDEFYKTFEKQLDHELARIVKAA